MTTLRAERDALARERDRFREALDYFRTHNHADSNHGRIPCLGHECRVCDAIEAALKGEMTK